jgi:DNA-binding FrmR family transcriptional regulator
MDHSFIDGRLYLKRTAEEREPLLLRLRKIEGQVRGVREAALLIMGQHLEAGLEFAVESSDIPGALKDLMSVLRSAMRQQS